MYIFNKRLIDVIISAAGLIIFSIPILLLGILIKLTSKGPIIHWSRRVGMNNKIFSMAKLRSMKSGAPVLSSFHFPESQNYFIFLGKFLRETGLDELPQLYNILRGDMSLVGPRPVILDDHEIIVSRNNRKISSIKPGLTGLAQIHGRNKISVEEKIGYDEFYMKNRNLKFDLQILFLTNLYLFKENFSETNKPEAYNAEKKGFLNTGDFFET